MRNLNMSVKLTGTALFVSLDETSGKFTFVIDGEDGNAYTVKLGSKGYDEELRSYVDDEDAYNRASEVLSKLNPAATVENAVEMLMGEEVEFYVADDRASFFEGIGSSGGGFTRFVRTITPAQSNMLKKLAGPVELTIFEDYPGVRFNVGFKQEFKGEELAFRVSQLVIPANEEDEDSVDENVSLKYTSKEIESYREQLKSGAIDVTQAARFEEAINKLVEKNKKRQAEKLQDALGGRDILELIDEEEPESLLANITVVKFDSNDGPKFYLLAEVIA